MNTKYSFDINPKVLKASIDRNKRFLEELKLHRKSLENKSEEELKEFDEFFAEKTKEVLKTIEELKKRISRGY